MSSEWRRHPVLEGTRVRLEPLEPRHAEGLHEAGRDPSIWTWLGSEQPADLAGTSAQIEHSRTQPGRFAWAQVDTASGLVAGTTSYYRIDEANRNLLIGSTWLGLPWQRTALNTEAKLLLLTRAFDVLGAHRVCWETDLRNERSQRAIERLGATREGVLRAHRVRPDGSLRDTVVYSVIAGEWPSVRTRLAERLK